MRRFDAVIFDMDGTLIEPLLDFVAIRAELGLPRGVGILEAFDAMDEPAARVARAALLAHETAAAEKAALLPAAAEVVQAVRAADLRCALLTRNAAVAMRRVLERFPMLGFDLAWSREDGPIKPEPDGVLRACDALDVRPARTACVGDFHYDIQAANAAGAVSVLLARGQRPVFADEADYVIAELGELPALLGV